MNLKLGENIKNLRKNKGLTQEQLSIVLGVSAGAVYKWESNMSIPDIELIIEMADFFDTSVDVLLGYIKKDNSLVKAKERISNYCKMGDKRALTEVEMILKKYPNSFELVYESAGVYSIFGIGKDGKEACLRALELYNKSLELISQNTNTHINETTISINMATVYNLLGEYEKSCDILKKYNVGGIYDEHIGEILTIFLNKPIEAIEYLVPSFLTSFKSIIGISSAYSIVLIEQKEYKKAGDLVDWVLKLIEGAKDNHKYDILNKSIALLHVIKSYILLLTKNEAKESLIKAIDIARKFDDNPNYGVDSLKFVDGKDIIINDMFGQTGMESINTFIDILKNEELKRMFEEIVNGK